MSFHRWTHKLVYIHRLKYYSAINKNKPSIPIQHQWISQELCQVKEAISKYYTVYGAFYVTVWKRQMHKEWRSSSGCHRPGEGEGWQQRISMREFIPFVKLFLYHQDFLSLFFFFKGFIYLFLERGKRRRKRGRETSRNLDQLPLISTSTRKWTRNPGLCPDWESNWWPVAFQDDAQPTEPHWSGREFIFYKMNPTVLYPDCGSA